MDRKSVGRVEVKDADKGTFVALIATFNQIDSDGDVTLPGAFPEGKRVPVSSYGHTSWDGKLPVGSAVLKQTRTEAVAEGRFYVDTSHGADTWSTLKSMQEDGTPSEWSYGYDPKDSAPGEFQKQKVRFLKALDVFEVSPTLRGAGIGTRTLDIKSHGIRTAPHGGWRGEMPTHETVLVDRRWDPVKALSELGVGASVEMLRSVHAWVDPSADPAMKSSYYFMHHERPGGAANLRACYLGIAALNGAKSVAVPDEARQGVYDHLAAHIRDADREAPELGGSGGELKLRERAMVLLADITALNGDFAEVGASRLLKQQRSFTRSQKEILSWLREELRALDTHLDSPEEQAAMEYLRYLRTTLS